ncbi:HAD family hydrolase [Alteromonas aestuariivivens]|uniref:HAD family hydrolase n=1 Tax=Alteromonas aestuariivivens TaxID=1938339 RepID=A0A3D8MBC0_9ALTE|nr:HAD-IA family hydrolase [Alteromonas aestuariivivens]RDV27431.1 HAD family hydrolase [Alteromonas aestuariivivens]
MKQYKLVIFDWDGTLMDSAAKIINCMQLAAKACGLPVPTDNAVAHIIGISLQPAIRQLFDIDDEMADKVVLAYKQIYLQQDATPCPLFDGVEALLTALTSAGITLAVATGKARRGLQRAWDSTATGHFFSHSRCACEADSKPSPDMLAQLLVETGVDVDEAVMIGDTTYDMQMAKALGMDRIAVSYGVHAPVNLQAFDPLVIVHSVNELLGLLLPQSESASRKLEQVDTGLCKQVP